MKTINLVWKKSIINGLVSLFISAIYFSVLLSNPAFGDKLWIAAVMCVLSYFLVVITGIFILIKIRINKKPTKSVTLVCILNLGLGISGLILYLLSPEPIKLLFFVPAIFVALALMKYTIK